MPTDIRIALVGASGLAPSGTSSLEVSWENPSGNAELDVWYSTEVSVVGNP